jgi:hypothetical protein
MQTKCIDPIHLSFTDHALGFLLFLLLTIKHRRTPIEDRTAPRARALSLLSEPLAVFGRTWLLALIKLFLCPSA